MPAATAQAGWVGFGSPAGNSAGLPVQQQPQSGNGMPRVVVERGPAAASGGGRAVGQPRQVAGGQGIAGAAKCPGDRTKGSLEVSFRQRNRMPSLVAACI
jgi:hypothetical protein